MSSSAPIIDFPSFTPTWRNDTYPAISPQNFTSSTTGKTIFITGGGSGLGPAFARAFATAGASKIALSGRTASSLAATKNDLEKSFPSTTVVTFVADSTDEKAVEAAFTKLGEGGKKVDVLINNAGFLPDMKPVSESEVADWWKGFQVNVLGGFVVARAFSKVAAKEGAVLINVTTGGAHFPALPGGSAYAASKLAAIKVFDSVQSENPHITVIQMAPGVLKTDMATKAKNAMVGGPGFPIDKVELPAHYAVWASTSDAAFLKGKIAWANWDVDEMKARKGEIVDGGKLQMELAGFPGSNGYSSKGVGKGWDEV